MAAATSGYTDIDALHSNSDAIVRIANVNNNNNNNNNISHKTLLFVLTPIIMIYRMLFVGCVPLCSIPLINIHSGQNKNAHLMSYYIIICMLGVITHYTITTCSKISWSE